MVPDNVFIAESVEEYADSLPPGEVGKPKIIRDTAARYRQFPTKRLVYVQEEKEDITQAAARIIREATEEY